MSNLERAIEGAGLTRAAFAREMGCSRQYLHLVIREGQTVTDEFAGRAADVLGSRKEWLFEKIEPPKRWALRLA